MPIIASSRWFLISEFQSVLSCLLEMDNGFTTEQWKHGRRRSLITRNNIVLWKNVIWNNFKSNHKISNQIQIKSHVFQIKSLFFKSNHYVWFNHDLNQFMIWICPSLQGMHFLCEIHWVTLTSFCLQFVTAVMSASKNCRVIIIIIIITKDTKYFSSISSQTCVCLHCIVLYCIV